MRIWFLMSVFSPNPYYKPESLRQMNGTDQSVYDYVMEHEESEEFYKHLLRLIEPILPGYQKEGKSLFEHRHWMYWWST